MCLKKHWKTLQYQIISDVLEAHKAAFAAVADKMTESGLTREEVKKALKSKDTITMKKIADSFGLKFDSTGLLIARDEESLKYRGRQPYQLVLSALLLFSAPSAVEAGRVADVMQMVESVEGVASAFSGKYFFYKQKA